MISTFWLIAGVVGLVALQQAVVLLLVLRNAVVQWQLNRSLRRSAILGQIHDDLRAGDCIPLKRELAQPGILDDVEELASLDGGDAGEIVTRNIDRLDCASRWTARATAAEVLGWSNSPHAVAPLIACVVNRRDELNAVRAAALRALSRIRHPDAVAPLIEQLASDEAWLPPLVADLLVTHGKEAAPALIATLSDADAPAASRRWAAYVLGEIGCHRALIALHASFDDHDPELRAKAAAAIGKIGRERSVTVLVDRMLIEPVSFVRINVAKALANISVDQSVSALVESLGDSEWWVRLRAVEGLASLGEAARGFLLESLHDREPRIRREAARALVAQGIVGELIQNLASREYESEKHELLIDIAAAGSLEPLLDELDSEQERVVESVIRILGRVGDRRAGPALARLLQRGRWPGLAARLIDALRKIRADQYSAEILPHLSSEDEWVRKMAVDYLGEFADPTTVGPVLPLIRDENPFTRESCLNVLERLRPAEAPALLREAIATEKIGFVRRLAYRAAAGCGAYDVLLEPGVLDACEDPKIQDAVLEGLCDRREPAALAVLAAMAPPPWPAWTDRTTALVDRIVSGDDVDSWRVHLDRAAERTDRGGRAWILATAGLASEESTALEQHERAAIRAAALGHLASAAHGEPDMAAIARALDDDHSVVRAAAVRTLASSGRPEAVALLKQAIGDQDALVREEAILGLAQMTCAASMRALVATSQHRLRHARVAAIVGLMYRGHPDAVEEWLRCLRDPESLKLLSSWRERNHPAISRILARAEVAHNELSQRLLGCASVFEAERVLLKELQQNPDPERRRRAVDGLQILGTTRPLGRIRTTFGRDPSPAVRAASLRFLATHEDDLKRLELIRRALADPSETVQIAAAHLTVLLEAPRAVELLVDSLGTGRRSLRSAVADLLAGQMTEHFDLVRHEVKWRPATPDLMVGFTEVLDKVSIPFATDLLTKLTAHRWARVRVAALRALLPARSDEAADLAARALVDPAPTVRAEVLRHLATGAIGDTTTKNQKIGRAILGALDDPSRLVRRRAAAAAGLVGLRKARPRLRAMVRADESAIARASERALELLDRPPVEQADAGKELQPS